MAVKTAPEPDEDLGKDVVEGIKGFVLEVEKERGAIPRDLFGIVSLLPRRLLGTALVFSLMALAALGSHIVTLRSARADGDAASLRYVMNQALPSVDRRLNAVEMGLSEVRGAGEKTSNEVRDLTRAINELAKAQARMEGKLDKALR